MTILQKGDPVVLVGVVKLDKKQLLSLSNKGTVVRIRSKGTSFNLEYEDNGHTLLPGETIVDVRLSTGDLVTVPHRYVQLIS